MAGKENAVGSEIDKTSFFWTGQCGACHPGGGPGEFDRDGFRYYDEATGEFGYEQLGKTAADVELDGDYAFVNPSTAMLMPAPWHVTGVSEADCLLCHRSERTVEGGKDMNSVWRQATLRSMANLVDEQGDSVPAYAAAPTATQGWHSSFELASVPPGKPPKAAKLQIDYKAGLADGSLLEKNGLVVLDGASIVTSPRDMACWGCHATPDLKKRGRIWFDPDKDVHFAGFNRLNDLDPSNDVSNELSTACTQCHPSDLSHDFAKGNSFVGSVRNDTDYHGLRNCADCHLKDSPLRDPNAPVPESMIHTITEKHLEVISCQLCHIPYKEDPAALVVDNSVTGVTIGYKTKDFLSADPLDPGSSDKSRWYPSIHWKTDAGGVERMFPAKQLNTVWWGDWDQNGTPGDLSDDVIAPLILWRVRQVTGGSPLLVVTDDNGDGVPEVNRDVEILAYIERFRNFDDSFGTPIAMNPVLVKGGRVWFEEPEDAGGLGSFEFHGTGISVESSVPFSIDHNVLRSGEALGDCAGCHTRPSPVFDREVLIDPFGPDGNPVYERTREILGFEEL